MHDRLEWVEVDPQKESVPGPEDKHCEDCRAGKLGDRFTLAIEEGMGALSCGVCGGLSDWLAEMDNVYFGMEPIPVSVAVETCSNPGGWHGLLRCDCDFNIVITPRTATSAKETQQ